MRHAVGRRRTARPAVVAAAMLAAGLVLAQVAVGEQDGKVSAPYSCSLPSGAQRVTVGFSQAYPAAVFGQQQLQPGKLTVTVSLPREAVAALLPAGAPAVAASGALTVRISQGSSVREVSWGELAAAEVPVAGKGELTFTLSGPVPSVTAADGAGAVSFTTGELRLELRAGQAGSGIPVTCAPPAGAAAVLGTVPVGPPSGDPSSGPSAGAGAGANGAAGRSPSPGLSSGPGAAAPPGPTPAPGAARGAAPVRPADAAPEDCQPVPTASLDPEFLPPLPDPEHDKVFPAPGAPPMPDNAACGYAVGYANITKLGQASLINDPTASPALVRVNASRRLAFQNLDDYPHYMEVDSVGSLQLPAARATFLTYGFIPTTAKLELKPVGGLTIVAIGNAFWNEPIEFAIYGYQSMRISDVKINGTPLDVGPDCTTAEPIKLALRGRQDSFLPGGGDGKPDYSLQGGGPISQKDLYIPPFTGCGTGGDNLDALFTAAVSGPDNSLNLEQGPLCFPSTDDPSDPKCAPVVMPSLPHRR
ncbi:DUF6801 domain-containing protein [Kitasatospora sp. NPDC056138]|uniref:DUF6801 domain-containing protein n=1 Tax=Kitasatospora sp. NPDC056138 TaxID=3345724 RepID=UPI0035E169FB